MPDDVNNDFHLFSQWFQPGGRPINPIIDGSADRTIIVESFKPEPDDEYVPLVQFSSTFDKRPYRRARNGSIGGGLLWQPSLPLGEGPGDGDGADLGKRMALVGRLITSGRAAFIDRRLYEVEGHYRAALSLLEDRVDSKRYGSARLHRAFFDGEEYLNEAVFKVAAFNTDPNNIHAINTRLDLIERSATDEHGNVTDSHTYASILLTRAFTLMRYASATDIQDVQYYEDAEEMVRTAMEHLTDEPRNYFAAELLLNDLLEWQMERAHHRGKRDARGLHKARLIEQLKVFTRRHRESSAAKRIVVALMVNHAVRLFGRMGLWEDALEWAIRITESDAYRHTRPARDLLSDPLFKPLVKNGKFIVPEEFKKRRPWFKAKLKRAWAAVDNAHTRGIGQSLGAGALGVLTGMAVDYAATGGESGSFLPALFAMLFSVGNKLWNGWITEEAKNADWFNRYQGTGRVTARQGADMAIRGGLTLLPWWGLMEAISVGPEFYKEFDETLGRAADLYMDFFRWVGDIAVAPFYQETYGQIYDAYRSYLNELNNTHPAWAIRDVGYVTYLGFTAKHYLSWLVRPGLRKELNQKRMFMNIPADLFYLPGALFLGAQLGAIINPEKGLLFDRLIRGSIATAEGLGMLFCGGVMALSKHKGFRESAMAMWNALAGRDRNILISLAITAGISSALGGLMGKGPEDLAHPALYVARGMGTSLGLLPLVYLVSGAMKQTIGWPESAKAAWQDARDFNLPTRSAIAVAGGLEAFWTPYTFNRLIRAILLDLPMATVRTLLGWDTNPGQLAFSLGNLAMVNHYATSGFVESVDTSWERDYTVENLEEQDTEKIRDNWKKAGLHVLPYHPLEPHSLGDAAYPLWAISRTVSPPPFPQRPEPNFFASQYQLITNGYYQEFDERHMDILLRQVARLILEGSRKDETDDSRVQAERQVFMSLGRSWVKTLWLARNDPRHGQAIQSFFRKYPWIPYVVKVNLEQEPEMKESRFRAIKRWRVKRAVRESFRSHRRAVMEYAARKKESLMLGLNVSSGKPPPQYTGPAFTGERRIDKEDKKGGGNPPPSPGAGTGGTGVPPGSQSKPSPPTGSAAARSIIPPDSIPDAASTASLGSFWKEEAPQNQEVIIIPMSARELRRRRARSRAKKGQPVILTGARPAPPGSANVPQIVLATEAALKPVLP